MNEQLSNHLEKEAKEQKMRDFKDLAKELSERHEGFEFPGVTREAYGKLREAAEEYPEYSTPIDELMERNKSQGIKVVLGKNPESGNVYILPKDSDDIEMDSIFPRHLELYEDMDAGLKKLIKLNTDLKNS